MKARFERLDDKKKLVDEVAEWLIARAEERCGAKSLSHFLLIMPTSQAERSLRLALAQRAGSLIPPQFSMPMRFVLGQSIELCCTPVEELDLWTRTIEGCDLKEFPELFRAEDRAVSERRFEWSLGNARELITLHHELETGALDFSDVASSVESLLQGENLDLEIERWRQLAELERRVRLEASACGLKLSSDAIKENCASPVVPEGVRYIVLPALADRPRALELYLEALPENLVELVELRYGVAPGEIDDAFEINIPLQNIKSYSTVAVEASCAARAMEDDASICIADVSRFPETEAAFLVEGLELHNPAPHKLASSSLGRLILRLRELGEVDCKWSSISSLVRDDDVRAWLERQGVDWERLLSELDDFQRDRLPEFLRDVRSTRRVEIVKFLKLLDLLIGEPEAALRQIYAGRTLKPGTPGDAEFIAAARVAQELFEAASGKYERYFRALFDAATYQLEPYSTEAIAAEGWLELQWSSADKLVITGFNEGVVPSSRVGHPYLPDRLAAALGLQSNEQREARDAYLLASILNCREKGAVKLLLAKKNSDGEPLKPSRLLFRTGDNELFTKLANTLYCTNIADRPMPPKNKVEFWDLRLPSASVKTVSPSGIDAYLDNPLRFLLERVLRLGEIEDDRAREYDALKFGNIAHEILQIFASSPLAESDDAARIFEFLQEQTFKRFPSSGVLPALQRSTMLARLERFAQWQADERRAGWKIFCVEKKYSIIRNGIEITGKIDRVDRNENTGAWRIIDYKTWDQYAQSKKPWRVSRTKEKKLVVKSLQLPLYRMMFGQPDAEIGYFLLTDLDAERQWVLLETPEEIQTQLEHTLDEALDGILRGDFTDNGRELPEYLKQWMQ